MFQSVQILHYPVYLQIFLFITFIFLNTVGFYSLKEKKHSKTLYILLIVISLILVGFILNLLVATSWPRDICVGMNRLYSTNRVGFYSVLIERVFIQYSMLYISIAWLIYFSRKYIKKYTNLKFKLKNYLKFYILFVLLLFIISFINNPQIYSLLSFLYDFFYVLLSGGLYFLFFSLPICTAFDGFITVIILVHVGVPYLIFYFIAKVFSNLY